MKKVLSVCSARPNFVKLAAVHHALKNHKEFEHIIVHTGQHYDPLLSDIFFTQLNIPQPNHNLGVKGGENREAVIEATAEAMIPVLEEVKPDIVLVYGDVNGAVGAARAAKKLGIKIAHVEAGLRSFDMTMPEELNRIEVDGLADILFCTEPSAMGHLEKEQIKGERYLPGNTMIDTLIRMMPAIDSADLPTVLPPAYVVATLHRPSNVDQKETLERCIDLLKDVAASIPVYLPIHPRLKSSLEQLKIDLPSGVHGLQPVAYLSFLKLLKQSAFVVTDSGGIQEEVSYLKKRCFTLRKNTERPITVDNGSNVLIDLEKESDRQQIIDNAANPKKIDVTIPQIWDGNTGKRIVEILTKTL